MPRLLSASFAAGLVVAAASASAQVRITEVAPWASSNAPYAADWFELTNLGTTSVDLSGWKMDDNSFGTGNAVALSGVASLLPGESAVFIETADPARPQAFISTWFGVLAPPGLKVGTYSGSGVGLGTGGDGVVVYNGSNVEQARVSFGASPSSAPFATFDNTAGLVNGATISLLSVAGVNGAFVAIGNPNEIGSPFGVQPIPEPGEWAFMLAGLGLAAAMARRRRDGVA